ncbi:transposase [Nocardia camponoti]|uniref:DUF4351 domain-containing protein n=1 Tax=Nocardia camponoti TaxID=1616106 RepID=A0A917QCC2_9NOCA|nr:transposase [Nocardia camponoti]GGK40477.1 hypothetical protein GCM10011591_10130 [Nocardia camponoti]
MTTASRLVAKGEAIGVAKGEAKGRIQALLMLLAQKFGEVPPLVRAEVVAADPVRLDEWLRRVLTADSIDDMGIV